MTYAWCLSCGQSFEASDLGPKWCCVYCDAPAQRLVASDRPIEPAVINGRPVVYSVLIKASDPPKYVSLAVPQAVKRREFREVRTKDGGQRSPRPRQAGEIVPARRENAALLELGAGQCRFCLTAEPPHLFCGAWAPAGSSWCAEHMAIVYTPRASIAPVMEIA